MGERRGTHRDRIIQKWILRKQVRRTWTGLFWLRIEIRSRLF